MFWYYQKMDLVSKPNPTSRVWDYYGFKSNEKGEPIKLNKSVCWSCSKSIATKAGNTTNLNSHLKHNHPILYSEVARKKVVVKQETAAGDKLGSAAVAGTSGQSAIEDATTWQCKYKPNSNKWCTLTNSVTLCIAKEMIHSWEASV